MTAPKRPDPAEIKCHELKTLMVHFDAVVSGEKKAEMRVNDRDFAEGDYLLLKEWLVSGKYSGRTVLCRVTHVLDDPSFLLEDMVMLSFQRLEIKLSFSGRTKYVWVQGEAKA